MRRTVDKKTGLPWARVMEGNNWDCGGCFQPVTGPMLQVPTGGHDASVICMDCLDEAMAEHRQAQDPYAVRDALLEMLGGAEEGVE